MTLQIVPLRRSVHPGCAGAFTILSYGGGGATVYTELMVSSLMTNDPDEVDAHQAAEKALAEEVALSVDESARLLDEMVA